MKGWKRRRINEVFLAIFVIWVIAFAVIPSDTYGSWFFSHSKTLAGEQYSIKVRGYATAEFNITMTFTAVGTFSAENTIHFDVTVWALNVSLTQTNLEEMYCCIGFTDAYYINPADTILQPKGNGLYTASGDMSFDNSGNVWVFLNNGDSLYDLTASDLHSIQAYPPIFTVSPVSDTLSVQFNEFAARIALELAAFNWLLMPSVVEGIFIRQRGDE